MRKQTRRISLAKETLRHLTGHGVSDVGVGVQPMTGDSKIECCVAVLTGDSVIQCCARLPITGDSRIECCV